MKTITVEFAMFYGATPDVFKKAKALRKVETEAEKILWMRLKRNQIVELQFRRQHPINKFIADFNYSQKLLFEATSPPSGGFRGFPKLARSNEKPGGELAV